MRVPAAERHLDECDPRLDQPAREEAALAELAGAVGRLARSGLAGKVERGGALVAHQGDGPLHRRAMGDVEAVLVRAMEVVLELVEQTESLLELARLHRRAKVFDAASRIGHDERLMASAEETGA